MPLYDLQCLKGHKFERFIPLKAFDEPVHCNCGVEAHRLPCAPFIATDIPGYESPITGEWIEGRAARREDLRKHGCVEWDSGMKEDVARRRVAEEAALDRALDFDIDKTITELPVRKRDALAGEMEAGVDVQIERRTGNG